VVLFPSLYYYYRPSQGVFLRKNGNKKEKNNPTNGWGGARANPHDGGLASDLLVYVQ